MQSGIGHLEFSKAWFRRHHLSRFVHGIEVRGDADFHTRTREALDLLRPLAEFAIVRRHLAVICQGKRSGIRAWAERPIFTVGAPTWGHSTLWYAGAIAHDAYHAKLYRDALCAQPAAEPRADGWSGAAAEQACLAFQSDVLAALDAGPWLLDYLEALRRNPTYQGRSRGWQSWLDYHIRWW